ncbi:hypothetical protein WJX84_006867 [Apatococcus fuscideae]|uniref:FG-GAP repeat-containing protein n=1 Tax=Apatococcus fuscideae TaxID=2026836 RepID=A0AAW1SPM1_9CHLO
MLKRDVAVLFLALGSLLFSLQHEGPFTFRKSWYHRLENSSQLGLGQSLPAPIVADLNGDGQMDILVAAGGLQLQLISPPSTSRHGAAFIPAQQRKSTILSGSADRHIVAMASGFLDHASKAKGRRPPRRKKVVVVLLSDWEVMCLDHNLDVRWQRQVKDQRLLPAAPATFREAAIHISEYQARPGSRGLVVVGGSLEMGLSAGSLDFDALGGELAAGLHPQGLSSNSVPLHTADRGAEGKKGVDESHHFEMYALDGEDGRLIWKQEGSDFHRDMTELHDEHVGLRNYRLDAASLASRQYGEVSCREFRESVMHVMPHRWARTQDTRMHLASFVHHRRDGSTAHVGGKRQRRKGLRSQAGRGHLSNTLAPVEVAPPAILPIAERGGKLRSDSGLAVFLTSRGEGTAYTAHGHAAWQVDAGATWWMSGGHRGVAQAAPTLEAMPLRLHALPSAVLAAGTAHASLISEHGHILAAFDLPAPPTMPLQMVDFSGDGATDVVLVTHHSIFGFVQVRQTAGLHFQVLLACLIVAMAIVFLTSQTGLTGAAPKGRSTDRIE